MNSYSRGSEWRRWELHTHTPCSFLNNGFGTDWDGYVKELFSRAIRYDVIAIGLTDYFTVDGYKKVKNEYLSDESKLRELFTVGEIEKIKKILVIPNIEFRIGTLVDGNRVNFHVIFSDQVPISDIEDNFLHELNFVPEANPQSEDEKWKLKVPNLEKLGRNLKEDHAEFRSESDICIGMKCAVVSDEEIVKVLANKKSLFKDRYLIFTPSDEDLSQLSWDGQDHLVRKRLIQKSDGLMASNANTIQWGLGKLGSTPSEYVKEFKSLKPCIWGADAHKLDELFTPSQDNYCWIKADPTFNGLKQIIYEPKDRVKIQDTCPDEKNDYQIIDEVMFRDDHFSPSKLLLNQNLTAIVGGKSTGKSVLLRNIAKTIDPNEVLRRLDDVQLADYPESVDDFEVLWRDGQSQALSETNDVSKKIIYIPQSYFNRLVDSEENQTSIDDILKGVLEQTAEIKQCFSDLESAHRKTKKQISETIDNIFFTLEDWQKQRARLIETGDKIGVQQEVDNLKKGIELLKASSGMAQDDILKYNQSNANIDVIKNQNSIIQNDINTLNRLRDIAIVPIDISLLSSDMQKKVQDSYNVIVAEFRDRWSSLVREEVSDLQRQVEDNNLVLSKENEIVKPLIEKIVNASQLTNLNTKYELELEKLKAIEAEELVLNQLAGKYSKYLLELNNLFGSYYADLQEARLTISRLREIDSDIDFELSVDFKSKFFQESFIDEVCNLRQLSKFKDVSLSSYRWADNEMFSSDIYKIAVGIISDELVLKGNYSKKEALTKLLQDWYILNYNITYKGDNLSQMSPGKKSFVLLKLLLDLDDSRCPLLIDQPEDDLDNRSIYRELVKYIKRSKKSRQVIIATHNPNLVVSADAEDVIVANQHGDESLNEKYQFEYTSGSLENTYYDETTEYVLARQGIKEHVCDILEGGELAFQKRIEKYNI